MESRTVIPFAVLVLISLGSSRVDSSHEKSIIKYLGTSYLLSDGCPLPRCDTATLDCQKTLNMVRNLYSHCLQSEEGQNVGCITDRMGDGTFLTVPIYASICSAMCYEPAHGLERVKKCPFPGEREHSPTLTNLFD